MTPRYIIKQITNRTPISGARPISGRRPRSGVIARTGVIARAGVVVIDRADAPTPPRRLAPAA